MTRRAKHIRVCRGCGTKVRDVSISTFVCTDCGGTKSRFWANQVDDPVIDPVREAARKRELARLIDNHKMLGNWHKPGAKV